MLGMRPTPPGKAPLTDLTLPPFAGDPGELVEAVADLRELVDRPRSPMASGAACKGRADVSWFPELGESTAPAKAVCATCSVRERCLDFAVTEGITAGIWGGLSPKERRRLRRQAPAA